MNQKMLAAGFILLLFFGVHMHSSAHVAQNDPTRSLRDILEVINDEDIALEHWGMYTKKSSRLPEGREGYVQKVKELQSRLTAFRWNKVHTDGEGNLKVSGTHSDRRTKVNERVTVIAFKQGNQWNAYTIYEVGSDHWSRRGWEQFAPTFHDRLSHYFPENAKVFSCVKGHVSGKMDSGLYHRARLLLKDFSAAPVEQIKEKTFVSLSAYTEKWKPSIQTQGKEMNLQVALRAHGEKGATTVTIGTPIITTEY